MGNTCLDTQNRNRRARSPAKAGTAGRRKRDAVATRERILKVGLAEFCAHGYGGARTARIARQAKCNIRMLYHYFGSKEALYIAALERVYSQIRAEEVDLDFANLEPVEGIAALVEFTFDYMAEHQEFVQLATIENIQHGRYLKRLKSIPQGTVNLIEGITKLLRRGQKAKLFRKGADPVQLYISILSLSYLHLSNKYTLSISYGENLQDAGWLAARRGHVKEMVLAYLRA